MSAEWPLTFNSLHTQLGNNNLHYIHPQALTHMPRSIYVVLYVACMKMFIRLQIHIDEHLNYVVTSPLAHPQTLSLHSKKEKNATSVTSELAVG